MNACFATLFCEIAHQTRVPHTAWRGGFKHAGEFKGLTKRPKHFVTQVLNLGTVVFSALMMWKGLICFTGSKSPVFVVLSGSKEPCFKRGDADFLTRG